VKLITGKSLSRLKRASVRMDTHKSQVDSLKVRFAAFLGDLRMAAFELSPKLAYQECQAVPGDTEAVPLSGGFVGRAHQNPRSAGTVAFSPCPAWLRREILFPACLLNDTVEVMAAHRLLLESLPASESVSRLRAEGKITADMTSVLIGFGVIELKREVRLEHRRFPNGGSWSFSCARDAKGGFAVFGSTTAG
jgi:hypothetical protein